MQHGIVQHNHARRFERAVIDFAMQMVVAKMVEVDIGVHCIHHHLSKRRKCAQQCGRIIGHARSRRRQRREKPDLQTFSRGPNKAVPMRTMVAPSSIATSRSCDIPMERWGKP